MKTDELGYVCYKRYNYLYYITFNYKPCNILADILNIRLAISKSCPISISTIRPGPKVLFGVSCLSWILTYISV